MLSMVPLAAPRPCKRAMMIFGVVQARASADILLLLFWQQLLQGSAGLVMERG